jgi:CRISPR system Cascade subunit CasE
MYLSRIELDESLPDTRRAFASPQIMHAAVENCFGPKKDMKERKLWRVDRLRGKQYLLILSGKKPDFTNLAKQFSKKGIYGESADYEKLLLHVDEGQIWRFRLRGNTVHSVSTGDGGRGKIYAHLTIEQQRLWLSKKALSCGFLLNEDQYDVVETDRLKFWRAGDKRPVSLGVAVFEGVLKITDKNLFKRALTDGIGRAKAYGCGLLTIMGQS